MPWLRPAGQRRDCQRGVPVCQFLRHIELACPGQRAACSAIGIKASKLKHLINNGQFEIDRFQIRAEILMLQQAFRNVIRPSRLEGSNARLPESSVLISRQASDFPAGRSQPYCRSPHKRVLQRAF